MPDGAFEHELPRSHDAPWLARRLLVQWLGAALQSDQLHQAKLLTSELVTNAILHGRGRILLRAHLDDKRMLIEVMDEGAGFRRAVRRSAFEDVHGRGLAIVDSEASRWGIHEGAAHVWFELARAGPSPSSDALRPARPFRRRLRSAAGKGH